MSSYIIKGNHSMEKDQISLISKRYKRITKAFNEEFWNSTSEITHSIYVGSYGRGTAINTSDLDILIELPDDEYERFSSLSGNGPSRLLQTVKQSILETYPTTEVKGDGQVVVINFSDGMKFEVLPAFRNLDWLGNWDGTYKYPDSHMGGNWMSTNPKAEQIAMGEKNNTSNGLLFDTCKHIRYVRTNDFSSYHLSGILIDSFVYEAIGNWRWLKEGEIGISKRRFEEVILDFYNAKHFNDYYSPEIFAPGSKMKVSTKSDWDVLGKVLRRMV